MARLNAPLLAEAWERRDTIRVFDGLYLALAGRLDTVVVTTDARLAHATPQAELVQASRVR